LGRKTLHKLCGQLQISEKKEKNKVCEAGGREKNMSEMANARCQTGDRRKMGRQPE